MSIVAREPDVYVERFAVGSRTEAATFSRTRFGEKRCIVKLTRLLGTRDGCQVGMQSLNSSDELRDFPSDSIDLECDLSVMVVISCEVSVASARVIEKRC